MCERPEHQTIHFQLFPSGGRSESSTIAQGDSSAEVVCGCRAPVVVAYLAGLLCSRHKVTKSERSASPIHMTVSAPPQ